MNAKQRSNQNYHTSYYKLYHTFYYNKIQLRFFIHRKTSFRPNFADPKEDNVHLEKGISDKSDSQACFIRFPVYRVSYRSDLHNYLFKTNITASRLHATSNRYKTTYKYEYLISQKLHIASSFCKYLSPFQR